MMTTAAPPQETSKNRYIPPEMVEEILLNLHVKPLLRFSSVSKSWKSMIFGTPFVRKHRVRAAVLGRERIVLNHTSLPPCSVSPSSFPLSAANLNAVAAALIFPYKQTIRALCDELWCLRDWDIGSLRLWNPSMRKSFLLPRSNFINEFDYVYGIYGLGYDSVHDDYKLLKVSFNPDVAELYSMRRNSWREINNPPFCGDYKLHRGAMGVCVGGALNWLLFSDGFPRVVASFDLSTEEYGELALPEMDKFSYDKVAYNVLIVLRGMLCVCMNYTEIGRFVLWMMVDYGVVESWTRKLDVDCETIPCFNRGARLRPFYFFDDGRLLISVFVDNELFLGYLLPAGEKQDTNNWVLLSEDEHSRLSKYFCSGDGCASRCHSFIYFESLVSPAMWARAPSRKKKSAKTAQFWHNRGSFPV